MHPPVRVHVPSGRFLSIEARDGLARRARGHAAPLFSELVELVSSGDVVLHERADAVDLSTLELRDFHALRAIATRFGWLEEHPIEIACHNCGSVIVHAPCASLELGPFVDGELDDPRLDKTLDLSVSHAVPSIALGSGLVAHDATLTQITVRSALPLHRALRRRRLSVSAGVVTAMGIDSLGPERDAHRIAGALMRCSAQAWAAIGDLFLAAHYPPRLSSAALCSKCGARNDVDAPYDREFEPSLSFASPSSSNAQVFPEFAVFDAYASEVFGRLAGDQVHLVTLVTDDGIPACDEGGELLLGAYVPPGGDPSAPVGSAEITLYFRTFRALWAEDGPYDWRDEITRTIEHELEHHAGWRRGHDLMDDEEREEIAYEHAARIGRKRTALRGVSALGVDVVGFVARTWPIWLIVAAWTIGISVCGRGGANPN